MERLHTLDKGTKTWEWGLQDYNKVHDENTQTVHDYDDLVLQYYELEDHYNAESNANNELQTMLDEKDELYKHTVSSVMYTNVTHMWLLFIINLNSYKLRRPV